MINDWLRLCPYTDWHAMHFESLWSLNMLDLNDTVATPLSAKLFRSWGRTNSSTATRRKTREMSTCYEFILALVYMKFQGQITSSRKAGFATARMYINLRQLHSWHATRLFPMPCKVLCVVNMSQFRHWSYVEPIHTSVINTVNKVTFTMWCKYSS